MGAAMLDALLRRLDHEARMFEGVPLGDVLRAAHTQITELRARVAELEKHEHEDQV